MISYIDGILPKGPYPPDRSLLAGYPRYVHDIQSNASFLHCCCMVQHSSSMQQGDLRGHHSGDHTESTSVISGDDGIACCPVNIVIYIVISKRNSIYDLCTCNSCLGRNWNNLGPDEILNLPDQYTKSNCGDKTDLRLSYLYIGISYTGKISFYLEFGPWLQETAVKHKKYQDSSLSLMKSGWLDRAYRCGAHWEFIPLSVKYKMPMLSLNHQWIQIFMPYCKIVDWGLCWFTLLMCPLAFLWLELWCK